LAQLGAEIGFARRSQGGTIMENRISQFRNEDSEQRDRGEPQPIGTILAELLAQYQARFPEIRIAIVQTPAVAV
jgi:hypothetical protein